MMKMSGLKSLRWIVGRGALLFLTTMFISSALVRILGTDGAVFAQQLPPTPGFAEIQDVPFLDRQSCAIEPGIAELLERIAEERRANREVAEDLERSRATLEILREEVAHDIRVLEQSQSQLEATLAIADGALEADLAQLTQVYETMKPKVAANLFETMEPSFAAGFLARMQPANAAAILAGLQPNTAYAISLVLSGRHAEPVVNQ